MDLIRTLSRSLVLGGLAASLVLLPGCEKSGTNSDRQFRYNLNSDKRDEIITIKRGRKGKVDFDVKMSMDGGKFSLVYCRVVDEKTGACYFYDYVFVPIGANRITFPFSHGKIKKFDPEKLYIDIGRNGRYDAVLD